MQTLKSPSDELASEVEADCELQSGMPTTLPNARRWPALKGLPPIVGEDVKVLVLGSMPGAESLRLRQYYAHPRNHFWRIVQDVFLIPRDLPYGVRSEALRGAGVAVWDVLASCHRQGSLDAKIDLKSMRVNAVAQLVASQDQLQRILFNGAFAERVYRLHLKPTIDQVRKLDTRRMPSTSPANASVTYEEKLERWRTGLLGDPAS